MSRARMNGILVSLLAAGALAGCGGAGDGTVASQAAPSADGAAPAAAEPVGDPTNGVVRAIQSEDPKDAALKHYDRFPILGASYIFVPPDVVQDAATAGTEATGLTSATATDTGSTATSGGTSATTASVATSVNIAQAEVDGTSQTLQVNTQIPATAPQFTVAKIDSGKVTLRLNSGTFPGGSNTIDIAAGASVTLSNPTTGAAIFILVKSIVPVGG